MFDTATGTFTQMTGNYYRESRLATSQNRGLQVASTPERKPPLPKAQKAP